MTAIDLKRAGTAARCSLDWLRQQAPAVRREALEELAEQGGEDGVAVLVESLKDDHPGVQQAALTGLIRIGGGAVMARLLGLLREPPAIRNMALEVIEQIMPGALEVALPLLASPDANVRKMVIDALGKQTDRRVVQPLLRRLKDPNANVRASAAEALGHLRAREAVPELIALLQDDEWVAFSAVAALAEIGDPSALQPLLDLAQGGREALRYAALEAIAGLDREGRTVPALLALTASAEAELRPALIKALASVAQGPRSEVWASLDRTRWLAFLVDALQDRDPEVQLSAVMGLGRLGDRRGTQPILDWYRQWESPSEEEADRVVGALVGTGDVTALIAAAGGNAERLAIVAVRALGELRVREAVPALAAVRHRHGNWELRKLAVAALAQIGTDSAWDQVREAIDDPTGHVRREAVRLLGESGRLPDAMCLVERLTFERYQDVRDEIVRTLVRVGGRDVMRALVELIAHGEPAVRESAARAIGLARFEEGLSSLIDAMNDPEWRVRQAVVEAIGQYDDPRVLSPLLLALSDGHEKVRLAATLGIARVDAPQARQVLMAYCLRDTDLWVRYRAVERLGAHRVAEAVPALETILTSGREPAVLLCAAITALAHIGGERARELVSGFLHHACEEVRETAAQALGNWPEGS